MSKIKLIILDIDECVTPYYLNSVDLLSMMKLQEYCLKMHETKDLPLVVLNSGRQVPYGELVVQSLGIFSDCPSVMESGCILYYSNTRKTVINPDISKQTIEIFKTINPIIQKLVDSGVNKEIGKELCISLNPREGSNIEDLFKEVLFSLENFSKLLTITHSKTAIDITPKGINKGSAIKIFEEKTNFDRSEMLAIGDSNSDLDIMDFTGFAACPSNANDNIKRIVALKNGYISPYSETKGVVDILEQLIFN